VEISMNKDFPTAAKLEGKPVYFEREVQTSDPGELFRIIKKIIEGSGFALSYEIIDIKKDEIGNPKAADFRAIGNKGVTRRVKKTKWVERDIYVLIAIMVATMASYELDYGFIIVVFILIMVVYIVLIFSRKSTFVQRKVRVKEKGTQTLWISGSGEIYGGRSTDGKVRQGFEMSIVIAGEGVWGPERFRKKVDKIVSRIEDINDI